MRLREFFTIHRRYGFSGLLLSSFYFGVKRILQRLSNVCLAGKKIILVGKSRVGIHHKTNLLLKNSKIIVEHGTFKVGLDFGYFDGGMFDSGIDVCRIHLINSTLRILGDVTLYPGVQIFGYDAEIVIGNGTKINGFTQIIANKRIQIGEECYLAQGVMIRDNDGHKLSIGDKSSVHELLPVKIGNHCWIGQRAMILKGTVIENDVVVAAGAVVTKNVSHAKLVGGVPAGIIYENVRWEA
jgi:acetyltransferase-like isoleucine patch superfamily enzyme